MARHTSKKKRMLQIATPFGSRTDIGCVRERNEDSLVVSAPLFAVADGMGGHAAGDVASEVAVRTLMEYAPDTNDVDRLGEAVVRANHAVMDEAHRTNLQGMGTTMTAAIIEGHRLSIAHVGDSRAYLLHNNKLQQLTRDHSLMADMIDAGKITAEEARNHPNRSIITRALGSDPNMQPDLYEINAATGDRLLLCSDGLSALVADDRIQSQLARIRDPQRCASALVNDAIAAGGFDNITVIVVDITAETTVQEKKYRRKSRAWFVFIALLLVAILAGSGYALYSYAHNSAYLKTDNGKVSVYRGVPGDLFGIPMSSLERTTTVPVDKLQPGIQSRLADGIQVDSIEAADELVKTYTEEVAERVTQEQKSQSSTANASSSTAAATSNPGTSQ